MDKKTRLTRKRKQQQMRLQQREQDAWDAKKMRQSHIKDALKLKDGDAADMTVVQWDIAHDIPVNALRGRIGNNSIVNCHRLVQVTRPWITSNWKNNYYRYWKAWPIQNKKTLITPSRCWQDDQCRRCYEDSPADYFFVYVPVKGVTLLAVTDCTDHISAGGTKDALYVV